ncbi:MAG: molybdenum cofactor guanylyltransferase MobA [Methylocystis sp.]|jgi:molybdopterin-guanine dinucleotide biosynthesis protein A
MLDAHGLILAGGLARRLGGVDKAKIEIGGETILARLVRRLAPQCAGLTLNANGDPERFGVFGLAVVPDSVPGFAGPLAGVLAGLDHVAAHLPDVDYIVSVPADTPFVPHDLVLRLRQARANGAEIAVASSGGREHHAVALWPVALRNELRRALEQEELRKVSGFIARYVNVAVDWPVEPYDPFFNVNRPEDLALAEELARYD